MKNLFIVNKAIILMIIFPLSWLVVLQVGKKAGHLLEDMAQVNLIIIDEESNYISNSFYLTDGLYLK